MNEIDKTEEDEMDKGFNTADITSHKQINQLIEDIKKFEEKYPLFDVKPVKKEKKTQVNELEKPPSVPIIDPENNISKNFKNIFKRKKKDKSFNKFENQSRKDNKKLLPNLTLKQKKSPKHRKISVKKEIKSKPVKPNIFRIGFNNEGQLVNLDLKKKKEVKEKPSKLNFLKKIFKREKSSEENSSNDGKLGKLKSVFGKVGKLKNAIPFKRNK